MKLKNFQQLKKVFEHMSFTTIEIAPGTWENINKDDVMQFLDQQQDRMISLAAAIADKLEKGELK